jgi:hypothetical protein
MKRWMWVLLLAAAGPGCVTVPEVKDPPPQTPVEVEEAPRPRPVMPDQVTEETADEKLRQLQDEVDHALHEPPRPRR